MCNDYGNRVSYAAYLEAFSQLKIRLFAPGGAPNLEPRDDIWPTDVAPIIRASETGAELIQLRWGFPPGRPKGPPVINMRSEKRRFPNGRCLVPASHFYEFTGRRSPKDKWRFTKVDEDWFCIAGLWRPIEGAAPAFTMLTCEPGPDVALFTTGKSSCWIAANGLRGWTPEVRKQISYSRVQQDPCTSRKSRGRAKSR
jgi:putative SOS response-associated peptidase YedK